MATILKPTKTKGTLTPTETILRDFIVQDILYDRHLPDLGPEDALLESELLDSIAIMQIVAYCEQLFEVEIPEEELLPEHFENIRAIGGIVERRLAAKGA
jgi:methoxymalonate biosynthesis acyl carrier protein